MNIFPALDFLIEKIKSGNFLNNLSVDLYPIFIHNPRPNIPLCLHLLSNQIIGNWPNMFNQTYWQQKLIRMLQEYISVNKNCLVFIILLELVGRGIYVPLHTSKINVLCSSLNSEEMLQNFLYLYKKKTQVDFFVFHFKQLSFFPYECPGLCWHRPGHS